MKIKLESVYISDLDKALSFYTDVLGFVKKRDIRIERQSLVQIGDVDAFELDFHGKASTS